MKFTLLLAMLLSPMTANTKPAFEWTPFFQQTALYFSSERVTIGGAGVGTGIQFVRKKNLIAQTDASILWGNGNAVSTRFALGYQRDGLWSPALFGTYGLLWGQRTEVLSDTGRRPAAPVWVAGLRAALLRFNGPLGSVSALELGYGIGPDKGMSFELTVLTAGFIW